MLKVYESIRSDDGGMINGRTKLFIEKHDEHEIMQMKYGTLLTPEGSGTMFIVDEWLIEQIDKVQFKDGALSVKDGEELIPPVKTEKQLRMEELERQMAELQAMPDEPTDTEEQSDEPAE